MSQFYISIMFIGILLIITAFIWVAIDKKRQIDYAELIDDKKTSLVDIVEDAEVMVDELNKFSGYVFEEFEIREKSVKNLLDQLDEEINKKTIAAASIKKSEESEESKEVNLKKAVGGNTVSPRNSYVQNTLDKDKDLIGILNQRNTAGSNFETKQQQVKRDNVIHLKQRYKKVLNMLEDGLTQGEIAKKLNMGKSEVQLILEMYKGV